MHVCWRHLQQRQHTTAGRILCRAPRRALSTPTPARPGCRHRRWSSDLSCSSVRVAGVVASLRPTNRQAVSCRCTGRRTAHVLASRAGQRNNATTTTTARCRPVTRARREGPADRDGRKRMYVAGSWLGVCMHTV